MNKEDLIQAVKARITMELEEAYRKAESNAYFSAKMDDRIILLEYLKHANPTVSIYIDSSIKMLITELVNIQLEGLKEDLNSNEKLIIEAYIKEEHLDMDFLNLVRSCKNLININ